jgi:hypothetical protein
MEIIDTKTATFSMLEKDILLVVMKEDAAVDVPESEENYRAAMQLTKGNRYGVLVDARNYVTITDEAKEASAAPEQHANVITQAIIITSLASRLIANFLIKFYKQHKNVEMKLFNDYDLALSWLKEKIKEDEQNGGKSTKSKKLSMLSSI